MEKKADSARVVRSVTAMMPASVFSAGMTAFAMLMVMMIAADIGVIAKAAGKQRVHRCIRFTGNPAVELDARFRQSDLCAAAYAAADQDVYALLHQKTCQCAVTAAICIDDFRGDDAAIRHVIELELLGVTKVLKNLTVFISDCDFHGCFSFLFVVGFLRLAGASAERMLLSAADAVVSASDSHRLSVDEARRDFVPRAFVDFLHGGARNIHLRGALLMSLLL